MSTTVFVRESKGLVAFQRPEKPRDPESRAQTSCLSFGEPPIWINLSMVVSVLPSSESSQRVFVESGPLVFFLRTSIFGPFSVQEVNEQVALVVGYGCPSQRNE